MTWCTILCTVVYQVQLSRECDFYRGNPLYVRRSRTITPRARYRFVLSPSQVTLLRLAASYRFLPDLHKGSRSRGERARVDSAPCYTAESEKESSGNKSLRSVSKRVFALFISISTQYDISCVLLACAITRVCHGRAL